MKDHEVCADTLRDAYYRDRKARENALLPSSEGANGANLFGSEANVDYEEKDRNFRIRNGMIDPFADSDWADEEVALESDQRLHPSGAQDYTSIKTESAKMDAKLLAAAAGMALAVALSNYLVLLPLNDWFTAGTLTYPFTFLLTDVTNRKLGKQVRASL